MYWVCGEKSRSKGLESVLCGKAEDLQRTESRPGLLGRRQRGQDGSEADRDEAPHRPC